MMRSMFAGVSGIRTHQIRMDVIGNNLANINTTAYKTSRVTFKDMLSQSYRGGTAPVEGGTGGINPAQVGLGVLVGSIDNIHSQGNLQATGKSTDMAIQGSGYFVLSNGTSLAYSRDGAFDINPNGLLINPSNGYKVQGWQANNSVVDTSTPVGDITIPIGSRMVAQATSNVYLVGNLNADAEIGTRGSISRSDSFIGGVATAASSLVGLFDDTSTALSLGITEGSVIDLSATTGGGNVNAQYTVAAGNTLGDFATWLQTQLGAGVTVSVTGTGALQIANASGSDITNLSITIAGNSVFNNVFDELGPTITNGASDSSAAMKRAALATEDLASLYNRSGSSTGLVAGDVVTISAVKGGGTLTPLTGVYGTDFTTLGEFAEYVEDVLGITSNSTGVVIDDLGRIVVNSDIGSGNAFTSISIEATNSNGTVQRNAFNGINNFTNIQSATGESATLSMTVYDSLGVEHRVTLILTRTGANTWAWNADCADDTLGGRNVSGGMQQITFLSNGTINEMTGNFSIDLDNGANSPLQITPDMSMFTQFSGASSISLRQQDGYAMGILEKFSIGSGGDITGIYSNGLTDLIGKIALATFSNPGGLTKEGENLYKQSINSGVAQVGEPGTGGRGTLSNGVLEMSNVDLANEFTEMIITQRGFQANSRIITTSDELLQELVNLKR